MNAMLYVRGNRRDFDRWRDQGNPGWGYDDLLPFYKKSEDMRIGALRGSQYHSTGGQLTVEENRYTSGLKDPLLAAAAELGLLNQASDYNAASQLGFAPTQSTIRDGRRCSNNKAFIRSVSQRTNLHIILESHVTKIIVNERSREATGVQFTRHGNSFEVRARKEVILCAGAVQSPQLLMLSGIGAAADLQKHGITPIVELPGVGKNLQDHIALAGVLVFVTAPNPPVSYISTQLLNNANIDAFVRNSNGPFYGSLFDILSWVNSPSQAFDDQWPDLQLFYVSTANPGLNTLIDKQGPTADGFLIYPSLLRPESRGTIELRSSNPFDYPIIKPNYFSNPQDFKILVRNSFVYLVIRLIYIV